MTKKFQRLSQDVVPDNYAITLKSDFEKLTVVGSSQISVQVNKPVSSVLLDSVDTKIVKATVKTSDGKTQTANKIRPIPEDERVELVFDDLIALGKAVISLEFESLISTSLRGYYGTKTRSNKGLRYFGATQFAATEARRCFPCWDEPSFKATFEITLVVPPDYGALGNMEPVEEIELDGGWKKIRFDKTPKMSSYLVAFAVGVYDFLEAKTETNVRVRVYTPQGMQQLATFALEVAVKALTFYEKYFNIPYPLSKADLLAVADFAYGAMENWGLIKFRESTILFDDKQSTAARKQRIAVIICHELAHQWFGNLVTMEWWTHLWLNEGFAQFMENLCMHRLYPEFEVWPQMSLQLDLALSLDALDSSHPIEVPIGHPSETDEIFDKISYNKGASIIGMLFNYIGDENFRTGVSHYLKKHEYSNAQTEDLWMAFEKIVDIPARQIMAPWTQQMGFPLISVKRSGDTLILSQEKFYSDAEKASNIIDKPMWKVPITIATSASKEPIKTLLSETSTEVKIPTGSEWIQVNSGATGVFRVLYDPPMLHSLITAIKANAIVDPKDRYIIHSDLSAQVICKYRSTAELLELTSAYADEKHYTVWTSIASFMQSLKLVLQRDEELHVQLCTFARKLYSKVFQSVGWNATPGEPHTTSLLRATIIDQLVRFDDESVLKEARRLFDEFASKKSDLQADLRSSVYMAVAKSMDDKLWDTFISMHKSTELQEESLRIISAVASAKDEKYLNKLLEMNLSDEIRSQDGNEVIGSLSRSLVGGKLVWTHFLNNHEKYLNRFNSGILLPSFIKNLLSGFATTEKAQEIKEFFTKNAVPGTERSIQQSLESILMKASWYERDHDSIKHYFAKNL